MTQREKRPTEKGSMITPHREPMVFRWWPPVRDILIFMIGTGMLYWQTVAEEMAQTELVGAGIVLIVASGAGQAERILTRWVER